MKYTLQSMYRDRIPPEFRFLCLDCAPTTYEEVTKLPAIRLDTAYLRDEAEVVRIHGDLRHSVRDLASQGRLPDNLRWFEAHRFHALPADKLDLSKGEVESRALARLALFLDLAKGRSGSKVYAALRKILSDLLQPRGEAEEYRVFLIADPADGLGSGWVPDLAMLVRDMAREIAPDEAFSCYSVSVITVRQHLRKQQYANILGLYTELDRFVFAGEFPVPYAYCDDPQDPDGIRGTLRGPLFDRSCLFSETDSANRGSPPERGVFMEVSDFLAIFCEQNIFRNISGELEKLAARELSSQLELRELVASTAGARTLFFPAREVAERLRCRLLLHLFGGGRFLDVVESGAAAVYRPVDTTELKQILREWREQPFLEQGCPPFFKCLHEFFENGSAPSLRVLPSPSTTPEAREEELKKQGRAYGEYLEIALASYLRGGYEDSPKLWEQRCGRIGLVYQLASWSFSQFHAFLGDVRLQVSEDDVERKRYYLDLVEVYRKTHEQLLEDLEGWTLRLVGLDSIPQPQLMRKPETDGLYSSVNRRYRQLERYLKEVVVEGGSRQSVLDWPRIREFEDSFFDSQLLPWVEGRGGLLDRLWFEVSSPSGEGRFAPRLELVFRGGERRVFHLEEDLPGALLAELGGIADRLVDPVRALSITGLLTGDNPVWPHGLTVKQITGGLGSGGVALELSDSYLRTVAGREPVKLQFFARRSPGRQGSDRECRYLGELEKSIIGHIWRNLNIDTKDSLRYSLVLLQGDFPVGAAGVLHKALQSIEQDREFGEMLEHVRLPEIRLLDYQRRFEELGRYRAPRMHPLLATIVSSHDRFRAFSLLYAGDWLRREQRGGEKYYALLLPAGSKQILTAEDTRGDLFEAALGFIRLESGLFSEAEEVIATWDREAKTEAMERTIDDIEREVMMRIPPHSNQDRNEQLQMLIYVELMLEKRRL